MIELQAWTRDSTTQGFSLSGSYQAKGGVAEVPPFIPKPYNIWFQDHLYTPDDGERYLILLAYSYRSVFEYLSPFKDGSPLSRQDAFSVLSSLDKNSPLVE